MDDLMHRREGKVRAPHKPLIKTRGFCWLPPLMLKSSGKWGASHILTIDDGDGPYVFRIIRLKSATHRWEVEGVWLVEANAIEQRSSAANITMLSQGSPPTLATICMDAQDWQYYRNIGFVQTKVHVRGALDGADHQTFLLEVVLNDDASPARGQEPPEGFQCCSTPDTEGMQHADPRFADFHTALDAFNSGGHYKLRCWGTTYSADRTLQAACVTRNSLAGGVGEGPITYSVMFARGTAEPATAPLASDPRSVQALIFNWAAEHPLVAKIKSASDVTIVDTISACSKEAFPQSDAFMGWSKREAAAILSSNCKHANGCEVHHVELTEPVTCRFCDGPLTPTADLSSASCGQGHVFPRCGITFMPLQVSGSSKHCARCGRLFLDMEKAMQHRPAAISDVVLALSDEFDTCPYCQGKFAG